MNCPKMATDEQLDSVARDLVYALDTGVDVDAVEARAELRALAATPPGPEPLDVERLREALANVTHYLHPEDASRSLAWADGSPLAPEDAGRTFVALVAAEYVRLASTEPSAE